MRVVANVAVQGCCGGATAKGRDPATSEGWQILPPTITVTAVLLCEYLDDAMRPQKLGDDYSAANSVAVGALATEGGTVR